MLVKVHSTRLVDDLKRLSIRFYILDQEELGYLTAGPHSVLPTGLLLHL
jgi:hypothetical protein